jgi:hypothetical protein
MKNVSRFLLASILLVSTAAFAQIGPPIPKPGPTPIVHNPLPPRMPPGTPRNPTPRLVSQVGPPIIVQPPTAPKPPNAPRNPMPTPRLG